MTFLKSAFTTKSDLSQNFKDYLYVRNPTQGKRNPSKMVGVARGHQRTDTLKPYSQKTSQSNHTRPQPCLTQKTKPFPWGHPRWAGHSGEV